MYLERNQQGDREKAYNLLNQALKMFQKMGARKDIEKTEARMMQIKGLPVTPEPKPIGYIATGYADLDKSLHGGIPTNCAVVLTSPSCDERDLLINSFLETGAKQGEVTFYVTTDPSVAKTLAEQFPSNFYLFVCNPQADAIVKDLPNVSKLKGVENLTEISIALTSAIHKLDSSQKGSRRSCIDLVSDVLLQHHAVQTRRWLAALIPELRSNGFTTLAVMDPEMHPPQEVRAVLDLFEGEISIFEKETEKGLGKYLKIKKMTNQKYLEDELLLKRASLKNRK
jgi:KaiC/GvpD/RAD55 family RecA-like ATPase